MKSSIICIIWFGLALCAQVATAQNLVTNSSFTNLTGWSGDNGSSLSLDGTVGGNAPPSAEVTGPGGVALQMSTCVDLSGETPGEEYNFGAKIRANDSTAFSTVTIIWFDDDSCAGMTVGVQGQAVLNPSTIGTFVQTDGTRTAPGTEGSARIEIAQNNGNAGHSIHVDDVYFRNDGLPVTLLTFGVD